MDCLAVTISYSIAFRLTWRELLKIAFFFGFFQGIMPLAGWLIGESFHGMIEHLDHWIALGILGFIGTKMIFHAYSGQEKNPVDIRNFMVLLGLSVATSIDALIAGISFGLVHVNILLTAGIIFSITFLMSVVGGKLGLHTRFITPRWAETTGGIMLILIGIKIFADHMGLL